MVRLKSSAPLPGRPVRGSATGRPIMAALDLLGRRWMLRVIWELRGGPLTSRQLIVACGGPSPSVLQDRLDELRAARLAELVEGGYGLTAAGLALLKALKPIGEWAQDWAQELRR